MGETSEKFNQATLLDTPNATSFPVSEDGVMRSGLPDGQTIDRCGPGAAHASPSAELVSSSERPIHGTYGQSSGALSPSAILQSYLESRLQARMDTNGSPEYVLTWKSYPVPLGPPICVLRASPRPMSENACIGWPTPTAKDGSRGIRPPRPWDTGIPLSQRVGLLLGWPTPTAITNSGGAALCKWGGTRSREKLREAVGSTVLNGALNPAFPSWLMGYPEEWSSCAAMVTPSPRKSRRSS